MNETNTTIIADLEAGIGTLTRLPESAVDVTIVVVEPTPRSIDVARRAVAVAQEGKQGRFIVVANKVASAEDRETLVNLFDGHQIVFVPEDAAIETADREGTSPVDQPGSAAVAAIEGIVDLLDLDADCN